MALKIASERLRNYITRNRSLRTDCEVSEEQRSSEISFFSFQIILATSKQQRNGGNTQRHLGVRNWRETSSAPWSHTLKKKKTLQKLSRELHKGHLDAALLKKTTRELTRMHGVEMPAAQDSAVEWFLVRKRPKTSNGKS